MSEVKSLVKRINTLLAVVERRYQDQRSALSRVVLVNAATGESLSAYDITRTSYIKRIVLTHQV